MDDDAQVLTLADLIAFLRRYLIALVAAAIAAGVLAYAISSYLPRQYEARAILLAAQTNPALNQFGAGAASAAPLDVSVYRTAALSPDVLADALQRASANGVTTDLDTRDFRDQLTVTTEGRGTSSLLTIAVRDGDPNAAAHLADAVAAATIAWDDRRARSALEDLVTSLTAQIGALDQQIAELRTTPGVSEDQVIGRSALRAQQQEQLYYARVLASSANGLLDVLQRAETPDRPVAPRPVLNAALAAILALTLVLLFGLLRDLLDTRVRTVDQVSDLTNLPMLAAFPQLNNASRHAPLEAANFLRANMAFALASAHPKVIVATSAGPSEGKTTVALALATSFARQSYRTLLIDLDLRKPMVATALGIDASALRVERFLDEPERPLEAVTIMLGEDLPLDVLPAVAGIDRPGERIATGIGSLLSRAQDHYDVIVFDTAPVMAVADALPVASVATTTVVAVSLERSNRRQVVATLDVLRRAGVQLAGTVATHAPAGSRSEGGAYGYGYGYGYGEAKPA